MITFLSLTFPYSILTTNFLSLLLYISFILSALPPFSQFSPLYVSLLSPVVSNLLIPLSLSLSLSLLSASASFFPLSTSN